MRNKTAATIATVGALLLTACGGNSGYDFAAITEECDVPTTTAYSRLLDDGAGYAMNTRGEESHGVTDRAFACVLHKIDIPDSVLARMNATRALDGMQTAEWDNITAAWTYHPKDGLSIILTSD